MKFYSDVTRKFYDTPEECTEKENAFLQEQENKANAEKNDLKKLDELYTQYQLTVEDIRTLQRQATKDYSELETAAKGFVRKYGHVPDKYKNIVFFSSFSSLL